MNNLCIHNVKDVFVTQKDFSDFRTFNLIVKDKNDKYFHIELFTGLKNELDLTVEKVPC